MTNEEFLKDVCPNHTEKSKWNRSELLHILDMHKKQLSIPLVSNHVICDDWIHEERVKQNDDTYCPICGKQLQSK